MFCQNFWDSILLGQNHIKLEKFSLSNCITKLKKSTWSCLNSLAYYKNHNNIDYMKDMIRALETTSFSLAFSSKVACYWVEILLAICIFVIPITNKYALFDIPVNAVFTIFWGFCVLFLPKLIAIDGNMSHHLFVWLNSK